MINMTKSKKYILISLSLIIIAFVVGSTLTLYFGNNMNAIKDTGNLLYKNYIYPKPANVDLSQFNTFVELDTLGIDKEKEKTIFKIKEDDKLYFLKEVHVADEEMKYLTWTYDPNYPYVIKEFNPEIVKDDELYYLGNLNLNESLASILVLIKTNQGAFEPVYRLFLFSFNKNKLVSLVQIAYSYRIIVEYSTYSYFKNNTFLTVSPPIQSDIIYLKPIFVEIRSWNDLMYSLGLINPNYRKEYYYSIFDIAPNGIIHFRPAEIKDLFPEHYYRFRVP